jgi:hypothetical protein
VRDEREGVKTLVSREGEISWDLEKFCLTLMVEKRAKMGQKMKSRFLDPTGGFLAELVDSRGKEGCYACF